jgi:DNA (cytosine-5)-methyltransferase 1
MTTHTCDNCKKSFSQKGHLEDHLKRKRPCKKNVTLEELVEKKVQEVISNHLKIEPAKVDTPVTTNPTSSTMDYSKMTIKELTALCKEKGIKGYSGKKKADIITLLCPPISPDDTIQLIPATTITQHNAIVHTSIVDVMPPTDIKDIKYIDLFCGIGGFHQALTNVIPTSKCVMASDIDEYARFTYEANHKLIPVGDIKKIEIAKIPKFNLICGGFPCQAFSIAQWKDKKAFDDPRGTLFFEILKIVDVHKPKCLLLENVSNLVKIQKGDVLQTLLNSLTTRGYKVSYQLLSPHQFGIPQNRERVYIVATASEKEFDFKDLSEKTSTCKLADILDTDVPEDHYIDPSKYVILNNTQIKTQAKSGLKFCGYLKGALRKVGAKEDTEHLSRVHKQLMRIYSTDGTHPTLAASETSGRYHIYDEATKRVRRLTLNECYKLMAYPSSFVKHTNKGVAYKHIGNSVCVRVIEEIVKEMLKQEVI